MATVITKKSAQGIEDYINSITLPSTWKIVVRRGYFSFLSVDDVVAGSNTYSMNHASSEDQLKTLIDSLSATTTFIDVLPFGGEWFVLMNDGGAGSGETATVTTYASASELATGTGLVVVPGLDDSTGNSSAEPEQAVTLNNLDVGDILVTYGGTYTLVKQVPEGTIILAKGGYYTTITLA